MTSEEEERPRFVTGGYGRHRRQWVKQIAIVTNWFWSSEFMCMKTTYSSHTKTKMTDMNKGYTLIIMLPAVHPNVRVNNHLCAK